MKNTLYHLLLAVALLASGVAQEAPQGPAPEQAPALVTATPPPVFVPLPEVPQDDTATIVAKAIIQAVNAQPAIRVAALRNVWEMLWENPRDGADPQAIFDALHEVQPGAGQLVLLAGQLAVMDLENIATNTGKTFAELVGDQKFYSVKYPITLNPDGTVTVQMPE